METNAIDRRLEGKTTLRQCQLTELYLLDIFVEICKRHNLKYFLDYGTLIGALRHNGFIPWDDDLDISMMMDDYLKFLEVAPNDLPDNVMLVTPRSHAWNAEPIARLVDRCSFFCLPNTKAELPCGIPIDLTPYEKWPRLPQRIHKWLARSLCLTWHGVNTHRGIPHSSIAGIFVSGIKATVWGFMHLSLRMFYHVLMIFCRHGWCQLAENDYRCHVWLDDDMFFPLRKHVFEGKEYFIPNKAEEILTAYYGDWRVPPRDAERGAHHQIGIICATQAPIAEWSRPYNDSKDGTVAQQCL